MISDPNPTRYDNYPTSPPRHAELPIPVEPPGPSDPVPPRHDRRGVLGTLAGLAVGAGVAGTVAAYLGRQPEPEVSASTPSAGTSPARTAEPTTGATPSPVEQHVTVGSHSATAPPGWTIERNEANEVVLTRGSNRVDAYAFTADAGDRAADLIGPLTRQRTQGADVKLRVVDSYAINVGEYVVVAGRGKLGGETAKISAVLWLDAFFEYSSREALLIVKVITSLSGSEDATQADDLSRQFGYDLPVSGLG